MAAKIYANSSNDTRNLLHERGGNGIRLPPVVARMVLRMAAAGLLSEIAIGERQTPADARRLPAGVDAALFCGLCAGAPGLEAAAAGSAAEVRQFWIGYRLLGAVCALVLLAELAGLAALEARRDRAAGVLAHLPAAIRRGNR